MKIDYLLDAGCMHMKIEWIQAERQQQQQKTKQKQWLIFIKSQQPQNENAQTNEIRPRKLRHFGSQKAQKQFPHHFISI